MNKIAAKLDKIAQDLENKGFIREAHDLDVISNTLDKESLDMGPRSEKFTDAEKVKNFNTAVQMFRDNPNKGQLQTIFNTHFDDKKTAKRLFKIAERAFLGGDKTKGQQLWDKTLAAGMKGQMQPTPTPSKQTQVEDSPFLKSAAEDLDLEIEAYEVDDSHPSQIEKIDDRLHDPSLTDEEKDSLEENK